MNADPFRPLPTRRDYEADMAQIDEPEPEPAASYVILYTLLGACATVSFGLGALIVWWL